MANELTFSKKSLDLLSKSSDVRQFCPDVREFTTIYDLSRFKLEGLGARVLRERVYFAMAELLRLERWKYIETTKITCYDCDTTNVVKEISAIEAGEPVCPFCGSDDIVTETVPAFTSMEEFKQWMLSELNCTYRTILMRKEFIQKYIDLGGTLESAFEGLTRHGVAWMKLTQQIEQNVKQGVIPVEEARRILENPESFTDTPMVVRYTETLKQKDTIECIALPDSTDFLLQLVDPDGHIRSSFVFVGIPISNDLDIPLTQFWNTSFGQMVARRLKVQTGVTYSKALENAPDYDFYGISEKRVKVTSALRRIGLGIFGKWEYVEETIEQEQLDLSSIVKPFRFLGAVIKRVAFAPGAPESVDVILDGVEDNTDV